MIRGVEQGEAEPPLKLREILSAEPIGVNFYKVGGTWDMVAGRDGLLVGSGNLDDAELEKMERELGITSLKPGEEARLESLERRLAHAFYARMRRTRQEEYGVGEHLSSWCRDDGEKVDFAKFAEGNFTALYSADSSHLRASLVSPIMTVLFERVRLNPEKMVLGAQGTDTADIALLTIIDALIFDTELPQFLFTGANRSHREENSDAPRNFLDLAKMSHIDLPNLFFPNTGLSGVFWIFAGNVYSVADLVKIDPQETRQGIENQSTFFSPHRQVRSVDSILELSADLVEWFTTEDFKEDYQFRWPEEKEHPLRHLSVGRLFDAFNSVAIIDMGDQNRIWEEVGRIHDPKYKAIVIESHSLGNVNNPIRHACIGEARRGKVIISVSRSLMGEVRERYAGSLVSANDKQDELKGTGTFIIPGAALNKTAARAIAVRAILANLNQQETRELLEEYSSSRGLSGGVTIYHR